MAMADLIVQLLMIWQGDLLPEFGISLRGNDAVSLSRETYNCNV